MDNPPRAQAEISGELLTVAVGIVVTATLGSIAFQVAGTTTTMSGPTATVDVTEADGEFVFVHRSGDEILVDELNVSLKPESGEGTRKSFESASIETFSTGQQISVSNPYSGTVVRVMLTHQPSGAVLAKEFIEVEGTGKDPTKSGQTNSDLTKAERAGPIGYLGDNDKPATDPDGDGKFEDVNGDGTVDLADTEALMEAYLEIAFRDAYNGGSGAADLYNFYEMDETDDDGAAFNILDVAVHYFQVYPFP